MIFENEMTKALYEAEIALTVVALMAEKIGAQEIVRHALYRATRARLARGGLIFDEGESRWLRQ